MKKPEGTIDLIGTGMQIGLGVIDLIKEFSPSPEQRKLNKRQRKVKVAIRQLRHRFKNVSVEKYVDVNFPDLDSAERDNVIAYISEVIGGK